jgi:glycosyltransferase involved in cell wall biosynthesis
VNVGLVVYGSLDQVTGGYLYDRILVDYLRECGDTVSVLSLPTTEYCLAPLQNFAIRLRRFARQHALDVLLEDELCHPSLLWANRASTFAPIVSIVHHLRLSERRPRQSPKTIATDGFTERSYLESVHAFVFNSRATQASVERVVGRRPSVIAYPGADRLGATLESEEISERAARQGPLRLLFVGSVEPRKNLQTTLEALSLLPAGSWSLTIAGDLNKRPDYVESLQAVVRRRSLDRSVLLVGALDDVVLVSAFRRHDALILPSWHEGYGIVIAEGLGFGLPAIVSSSGGAVEIVEAGRSGLVVDPNDAAGIAAAVSTIADRETLKMMSLAARERYNRLPTWRESMRTAREFLLSLVRGWRNE